jgi:hypothetical protein
MAKLNFCTYTKKEFMSMMEKIINDNDVVILTTAVKTMETKPKLKLSFLSFQFPHEMLNEPDDIRGLVVGNVVSSIIVARNPKETVSKEYMKQLKKNDGVYGFTIEQ